VPTLDLQIVLVELAAAEQAVYVIRLELQEQQILVAAVAAAVVTIKLEE
jgi:hypothetical protein